MIARTLNLLVGSWLFLSAFVWRHPDPQFTNTWLVGLLCAVIAVAAVSYPRARYWNVLLSAWLVFSTLWLPHLRPTVWNNIIVALAMLAFALVPSPEAEHKPTLDERLQAVANAIAREQLTRGPPAPRRA
ncbi:MAG TPA: hypothetical protein VFK85_03510 [Anaeromyxobacteraceae bacterium]|nr:hypothetical protein [Anaeromyxobacteraceae bacterium]